MYETLSKQELNAMTSDSYKAAFEGAHGDDFRKRVSELENQPAQTGRPRGNVRGDAPSEQPASPAFDPSFDDVPNSGPSAAAPAPVPAAAPAAAEPMPRDKMSVWEYQPRDQQNRPVGGLQRFYFDPSLPNEHPQSLASQLTRAHSCATTALKAKKTREFIDSVKSEDDGYVEPKLLTVFDHPEAEALNAMTATAMNNAVQSALSLFKQRHSEFVLGDDNAAAMVSWVIKSKRNPASGATWEAAWSALKPLLLPDEAEVAAPAPAPVAAAPAPKAAAVPTVRRGGVATGLSSADSFNPEVEAAPVKVQGVKLLVDGRAVVMDLRTWDRQSSDFQKRALRNPNNAAAVNALYERQAQELAAARGGR
jgi:hypothetical protein